MDLSKIVRKNLLLSVSGLFLLMLPAAVHGGESQDVKVIDRKPDPSNPAFEIVKVEGGLVFRVPKDMTFVKQDGLIMPLSTEEYSIGRFSEVDKQIEMLRHRVETLEKEVKALSASKDLS